MSDPFADLDEVSVSRGGSASPDPFADLDAAQGVDPFADLDGAEEQPAGGTANEPPAVAGSATGRAWERGKARFRQFAADVLEGPLSPGVWFPGGKSAAEGRMDVLRADAERRSQANPAPEGQGLLGDVRDALVENVPTSMPVMIGAAGGSMLGPVGAALGAGLGSGAVEYGSSVDDYLRRNGVDFTQPEQIRAAYNNEVLMEGARDFARKRAVVVGAADAATAGVSGRVAGSLLRGGRPVKAAVAGLGIESLGGAAGEAGAQIATEGQVTDWKSVGMEAAAEVAAGGPTVAASARGARGVPGSGARGVPGSGARVVKLPPIQDGLTPRSQGATEIGDRSSEFGNTGADPVLTADPYAPESNLPEGDSNVTQQPNQAPGLTSPVPSSAVTDSGKPKSDGAASSDPFVDLDAGLSQPEEAVPGFEPMDLLGLKPAVPEAQAGPTPAAPVRSLADVFADLDAPDPNVSSSPANLSSSPANVGSSSSNLTPDAPSTTPAVEYRGNARPDEGIPEYTKRLSAALFSDLQQGKPFDVVTQTRIVPVRDAQSARLTKSGELQVREGKGWVSLGSAQVEQIAMRSGMIDKLWVQSEGGEPGAPLSAEQQEDQKEVARAEELRAGGLDASAAYQQARAERESRAPSTGAESAAPANSGSSPGVAPSNSGSSSPNLTPDEPDQTPGLDPNDLMGTPAAASAPPPFPGLPPAAADQKVFNDAVAARLAWRKKYGDKFNTDGTPGFSNHQVKAAPAPANSVSSAPNSGSSSPNLTPSAPSPAPAVIPQATPAQKAAVKKEVRTPEPVKQGQPFDTKAAQGQKKWLLSELDKAIEVAPEKQSSLVKDDFQKAIDKMLASLNEYLAANPGKDNTDLRNRITQLETNMAGAPDEAPPRSVLFSVPGDGEFRIPNTKEALRNFKKIAAAKFPTSSMKPPAMNVPAGRPTGVAVGKLDAPTAVKVASEFVSGDPTRDAMANLFSDESGLIATNGRQLLRVKPVGLPQGELDASTGKPLPKAPKFPGYKPVIDVKRNQVARGVDAQRLIAVVRQAMAATKTSERADVQIHVNPDGTIGASGDRPGVGEYSHNVQDGARPLGLMDGDYLIDGLSAHVRLGQEKVDFELHADLPKGAEGPLFIVSPVAEYLQMPMKPGNGKPGVAYTPEQEARFRLVDTMNQVVQAAAKQKNPVSMAESAAVEGVQRVVDGHYPNTPPALVDYAKRILDQYKKITANDPTSGDRDSEFRATSKNGFELEESLHWEREYEKILQARGRQEEYRKGIAELREHLADATSASDKKFIQSQIDHMEKLSGNPGELANLQRVLGALQATSMSKAMADSKRKAEKEYEVARDKYNEIAVAHGEIQGKHHRGLVSDEVFVESNQRFKDALKEFDRAEAEFVKWQNAKPKRGKKNTKDNPFPAGVPRPGWAAAPYDGGADKVEAQTQGGLPTAGWRTVRQPFSTPELLKLLTELGIKVPRIMRDLGARGRFTGAAPGTPGPDGRIDLDASTARLLQPKELMALEAQAADEAQLEHDAMQAAAALGGAPVPADFLQTRTDELFRELAAARLEWAKENRGQEELAKTLNHEMGHLISYSPDRTFGRGNILGRFFHAAKYTRKMLAEHPSMMGNLLTNADRARLGRQAEKAAGAKPTDPAALAAWTQARKNAYTNLLDAEASRRGLVQVKDVVRETDPLIAWWQGEERIPGYYRQPEERWAELLAIYALAPGQFQTRARMTYTLLDNWLTANPEFKRPFDAIQQKIETGEHITEFEQDLEASMDAADKDAVALMEGRDKPSKGEVWDNFLVTFDRRRGAMLRRLDSLRKTLPDVYERAKGALKTWQYKDNANKAVVDWGKKFQAEKLAPSDISWRRFGTYLFLRRVLKERYDLANTMGTDSRRATIVLDKWRQSMGPDRFAAMEAAAADFDARHQQVLDYIEKTGTERPELMAKLRGNDAYATFSVMPEEIPEGGSLAEMIATADPRRPGAGVKRQVGTLKRVENPATATMKKWMQWMNQADKQVAIRENVKVLRDHFGEARPANLRFIDGRPQPVVKEGGRVGTVMWRENGRVMAAYVPRSIADAFNTPSSAPVTALARKVAGTYQALHTAWNPAFWPVGFTKDIMGSVARTPGMSWLGDRGFIRHVIPALRSAWGLHFGTADSLGQKALDRRMLQGLRDSGLFNENDAGIDRMMREFGQAPLGLTRRPGVKGFLDSWNRMGQVFEHAVKIAGMTWVDAHKPNLTEEARREMVRVNIGSPEFGDAGTVAPWMNLVSPFLNAAKQGWRAQYEARHAFDNKWEYAGKLVAYGIGPRLALSALAYAMWPDDEEREAAKASIPNRDKRLYLTIPLGWYDKNARKVAYLRIPQDETSALIGGLVESLFDPRNNPNKLELLEFAGSRFKPGDNNLFGLPFQWLKFMATGEAPVDSFTGRKVMSENQEAAGGAAAWGAMAKHSFNQLPEIARLPLGLLPGIPGRFDITSRPEVKRGMLEELSRMPGASRIFRVSNAGLYDQVAPARAEAKQARARELLALQNGAARYAEGKTATTEELRGLLANKENREYFRGQIRKQRLREEDPVAGMIDAAGSKREREAVRRALAETAPPR